MLWDAAQLAKTQGFDWDAYYNQDKSVTALHMHICLYGCPVLVAYRLAMRFVSIKSKQTKRNPSQHPTSFVVSSSTTEHQFPTAGVSMWTMYDHGVNNAMGTKSGSVWFVSCVAFVCGSLEVGMGIYIFRVSTSIGVALALH